jgi:hypothetical protein
METYLEYIFWEILPSDVLRKFYCHSNIFAISSQQEDEYISQ